MTGTAAIEDRTAEDVDLAPEVDRSLAADTAPCPACLAELFDPSDRRYRYPFITCPRCGPRSTIIEELPYGRERTSMRAFTMCDACAADYHASTGRRFHDESVACPACGPHLTLLGSEWGPLPGDPVTAAADLLRSGSIVALKGLGGFQLACDATNEETVAELRQRKGRPDEPFAVMFVDLAEAMEHVQLGRQEAALLASPAGPVVLAEGAGGLAPSVAPGQRTLGVMLPSTALHHLLMRAAVRPLVMTGGKRTVEPVAITNEDARHRLGKIADAFLVHDREIVSRYGDPVVLVRGEQTVVLRRGREMTHSPLLLPTEVRPTLSTGAQLDGAFCIAAGDRAFLSPHIGRLSSEEAMRAFSEALTRTRALLGIDPEMVAHDLHPDFQTTLFAQASGLPTVPVQHHHAHVAAVMAEHHLHGSVIGVAFDGFGLGDDGTGWGGEFLVTDWRRADRVGHLRRVRQPGGAVSARRPVRMALAHAADAGVLEQARKLVGRDAGRDRVLLAQLESGFGSPMTSSAGRLFDAVAALTGVCRKATYDGQAASLLEQVADPSATFEYPFDIGQEDGRIVVDTRPIVAAVIRDLGRGRRPGEVAGRFHRTLSAAVLAVVRVLRASTGLSRVVLAGGLFTNDLLVSDLSARLVSCDFQVFTALQVPSGDGGIALGQVLVAHGRTNPD